MVVLLLLKKDVPIGKRHYHMSIEKMDVLYALIMDGRLVNLENV